MPHIFIKDLKENVDYKETFICVDHRKIETRQGSQMLKMTVSDNSGKMDATMFNVSSDVMDIIQNGYPITVGFHLQEYRGVMGIICDSVTVPSELTNEDLKAIVPFAPVPGKESYTEMMETAENFKNPELKAVVLKALEDNEKELKSYPAAKSMHHAYIGGLAYHENSMLKIAKKISELYEDTILNKELLFAGVILHDIKKIEEFNVSKLRLVDEYSTKGKLIGHIQMGYEYVGKICDEVGASAEVKLCLQHMILSHHGEPDFGSPVRPMFLEAFLLHEIDTIDAHVNMYLSAENSIEPGEFSQRIFGLENVEVYRPNIEK